jgi:hypothetical protein
VEREFSLSSMTSEEDEDRSLEEVERWSMIGGRARK